MIASVVFIHTILSKIAGTPTAGAERYPALWGRSYSVGQFVICYFTAFLLGIIGGIIV